MKRRIVLIVVIAALLVVAGGGIFWYVRRGSGVRLLGRAQLAMRAEKFDKALALSETYISKHPGDWRGYFYKADALVRLGRYAEARPPLAEAQKLNPAEASLPMAMASTYSLPARRVILGSTGALIKNPEPMLKAVSQLEQANEILAGIRGGDKDSKAPPDARGKMGLNLQMVASVQRRLGEQMLRDADLAKTSRAVKLEQQKRRRGLELIGKADRNSRDAIEVLLEVVTADPSLAQAARALVELCISRNDTKSLAQVRNAIQGLENPPPIAAMLLAVYDLRGESGTMPPSERRKEIEKTARFLDTLLERHPDNIRLKLSRAELAMMTSDFPAAENYCRQILKANPRDPQARLLLGRGLMSSNRPAEAVAVLERLKTEFPTFAAAHYAYALAELATGRHRKLAEEAMRTVTKLAPAHGGARKFLAETLLRQGFAGHALEDAREYYIRRPANPDALRLYVASAVQAGQGDLARKALETSIEKYPSRADLMIETIRGFLLLGDEAAALKLADKITRIKPAGLADSLAVVQGLMVLNRFSEAEKMLLDQLSARPKQPQLHYELARIYEKTARTLQALEQYQIAFGQAPGNQAFGLALADALFAGGDWKRCRAVLDQLDASNAQVNLLRLRLKLLEGKSVDTEQILQQLSGSVAAERALARTYLHCGRPEKTVELTLAELKEKPNDPALLSLLGQAYLAMGKTDQCLQEWKRLISSAPDQLPTYLRIAGILSRSQSLSEVGESLAAIPDAKGYLVNMTIGWFYSRRGQFAQSAGAYQRVADDAKAPAFYRNRARLLRAQALGRSGQVDQAVEQLDTLAKDAKWRNSAISARAEMLVSLKQGDQAGALKEMHKIATAEKNVDMLRRLAELYLRAGRFDDAMGVCSEVQALKPTEARWYRLRAKILAAAGRTGEIPALLNKAIKLQGGDYENYLLLARTLDNTQQPGKALDVLDQLESMGHAAKALALFEKGNMFARWGLQQQAIEAFGQLAGTQTWSNPKVQLVLGGAFAALGQKDQARKVLEEIPLHSPQYITARQQLAWLADGFNEKLKILRELDKAKPGRIDVLGSEMQLLLSEGRPAMAVRRYRLFVREHAAGKPMPPKVTFLALRALLRAGNAAAAADLAIETARKTRLPRWRVMAILLNIKNRPQSAENVEFIKKLFSPVERASLYECLLGMVLSARTDDAEASGQWAGRIDKLAEKFAGMTPPRQIPARYRFISAVMIGSSPRAKAELEHLGATDTLTREAAGQLVRLAAKHRPQAVAQSAGLLEAMVAGDLGLGESQRTWAMKLLKDHPTCQWAAVLAVRGAPTSTPAKSLLTLKRVSRILQPKDCLAARMIRLAVLVGEKKYNEAAEIYRKLAAGEKDQARLARLRLDQAVVTEQAGKLKEALELYRQALNIRMIPTAANNAAYLVSQLYPTDQARLGEAASWMDGAIKARPSAVGFLDTRGWIEFLRGRTDQAARDVRRAVRGLGNSIEVHYHLGMIESALGNADLSRWHLSAAVSLARAKRSDGGELTVAEAEAAKSAEKALGKNEGGKKK